MEDSGRFSGSMKFASAGMKPNELTKPGVEKSSITSLYIIPVYLPTYLAPKLSSLNQTLVLYFLIHDRKLEPTSGVIFKEPISEIKIHIWTIHF